MIKIGQLRYGRFGKRDGDLMSCRVRLPLAWESSRIMTAKDTAAEFDSSQLLLTNTDRCSTILVAGGTEAHPIRRPSV